MTAYRGITPLAGLVAWEAITSLGESAAETALLLRAGIVNVSLSHFIDAAGERVMLCHSPALPATLSGADRLVALAAHALLRLLPQLPPGSGGPLTVLLALPERLAAVDNGFDLLPAGQAVRDGLRRALPVELAHAEIECFPFGRAAGALALRRALDLLSRGTRVVWGGVDSQHDWDVLQALEQADRLLTAENVDGVRPGEAAAFVALAPAGGDDAVNLLSVGLAREPHPVGSDEQSQATGLCAALDNAVEPLRHAIARSNYWLLDNTHEVYATQALQNVITRFGDVLGLETELHMPLKELGDAGAAAMPLLATLAAQSWRTGHACDHTAVITGCSERGARGAMLLAARPTETSP